MSEIEKTNNFFRFSFDKIPELERNKKGTETPLGLKKIENVLNNIGVKISSILKNTGLDTNDRISKLDKEIQNLFEQLNRYLHLAINKKIEGIKKYEEVPLFVKLQQAITIYDNHDGNIKESLRYLTEIEAKKGSCSVKMDETRVNSKGLWSSELSKALKELYEDYSNFSVRSLNKQSSKKDKETEENNEKKKEDKEKKN